jgi:methionyl-tRNA formyltransferase
VRIVVAATPDVAIPTLDAILKSEDDLAFVITQPDRAAGRGKALRESSVSKWASANSIRVIKPLDQNELEKSLTDIDLVITIGFGVLLRASALTRPKYGFLNLHFSLLPRWRGAAPVQRAIEAGDAQTGVTVFALDSGMDTGPIYRSVIHPIAKNATTHTLLQELAVIGAPQVLLAIADIKSGLAPLEQDSTGACKAPKLSTEQARIDWSEPAEVIERKVRAFYPSPGAWTLVRSEVLKIQASQKSEAKSLDQGRFRLIGSEVLVGTGTEDLILIRVKPAGKPEMDSGSWARGFRPTETDVFE